MITPLASLLLAAPGLPPSPAQDPSVVLRRDEFVAGRPVKQFERAVVDDDGSWSVVALLGQIGHNLNGALVRSGNALLLEGQLLTPPVARVRYLGVLEGHGDHAAQNAILDSFNPPRVYPSTEAILYRGTVVLTALEPADVVGLPPTTLCTEILNTSANGHGMLVSVVELDSRIDRALLAFEFDANGTPLARKLLLRVGDALPDGSTLADFMGDPAIDESGGWLLNVLTTAGRRLLVTDTEVLIGTGDAAPLPGRLIGGVTGFYDRNDFGDFAAHVDMDGDSTTNGLLIRSGQVLYQEGELLPSLSAGVAPEPLADIGQVRLANSGHVYWHARTGAGTLTGGLFMRDRRALLQAGVSEVAGERVAAFALALDNFEISPSGRFWVGRVQLESSGDALVLADLGASRVLPGCTPNAGTLRHTDGLVLAGQTIRLVLDGPAQPGALASVFFAGAPAVPGSPCGIPSPIGELLLDPARVVGSVAAGAYAGAPLEVDVMIPPSLALVDREIFAQAAFLGRRVLLTNGLSLEVGAP
jgi:hypothetical protein